jgi:regulator of replication initiation timing
MPAQVKEIHGMLSSMHDLIAQVSHQNADLSKELARSVRECDELRIESEELKRKLLSAQHEHERQQIAKAVPKYTVNNKRKVQAPRILNKQYVPQVVPQPPVPQFVTQIPPVVPSTWVEQQHFTQPQMVARHAQPLPNVPNQIPINNSQPQCHHQMPAARFLQNCQQGQQWQTVPGRSTRSYGQQLPTRRPAVRNSFQTQNRFAALSNSPKCHFCGETGHMKRQCAFSEPVQCFTCFNYGHKSKSCDMLNR